MQADRRAIRVGCPTCGAPPYQRCVVRGSRGQRFVGPTYYGPREFHKGRVEAAPSVDENTEGVSHA